MSDQIVQSADLTTQKLTSLLEDAYINFSLDSDGDIIVEGGYRFFVLPGPEKNFLTFVSRFRWNTASSEMQRYQLANRVNDTVIGIRACVEDRALCLDLQMLSDGGITKKNIVMSIKRFENLIRVAISKDTDDILA